MKSTFYMMIHNIMKKVTFSSDDYRKYFRVWSWCDAINAQIDWIERRIFFDKMLQPADCMYIAAAMLHSTYIVQSKIFRIKRIHCFFYATNPSTRSLSVVPFFFVFLDKKHWWTRWKTRLIYFLIVHWYSFWTSQKK